MDKGFYFNEKPLVFHSVYDLSIQKNQLFDGQLKFKLYSNDEEEINSLIRNTTLLNMNIQDFRQQHLFGPIKVNFKLIFTKFLHKSCSNLKKIKKSQEIT